jgi:hypothetical protein
MDDNRKRPELLGALVGWKRIPTEHGAVFRLQVASSLKQAHDGPGEYDLALNLRQLQAFAHDLQRAADVATGLAKANRPSRKRWFF